MSGSDIAFILTWWLWLFAVGIVFFPVSSFFFRSFVDKGYIFAKILGIIFLSYAMFLLGILHIIQFDRLSLFFLIAIPLLGYIIFSAIAKDGTKRIKRHLRDLLSFRAIFVVEELLFLAGIFFLASVRSYSPDIHGLEKFMDFGFINSIGRSTFFPPKDMWLPPFSINYYYFGHLVTAVLIKLTNIPSFIGYNLMLATIFSFCLVGSFSLAGNFIAFLTQSKTFFKRHIITAAVLTSLLVTLGGNLHTIYTLYEPYENEKPVPPWELVFSPSTFPNAYWYPNATRFIYNTIHEFPIYSWTVADLHGHVLDIPFVLLTIAILFSLFQFAMNEKSKIRYFAFLKIFHTTSFLPFYLLIGFLLAIMYMTNAWDGIIYFLLSFFIVLFVEKRTLHFDKGKYSFFKIQHLIKNNFLYIKTVFFAMLTIAISFILFSQPFTHFFKPFVSGVGLLCAPNFLTKIGNFGPLLFEANHCQHSPWWQLLILYGFFYFFVFSFLLLLIKNSIAKKTDYFILILIFVSSLLILIPEFIYIKDIYPAHYRANTMFKLVFQAFIMLSLCSGYIILRVTDFFRAHFYEYRPFKKVAVLLYYGCTLFLIALVMIYPYLAFNSYYGIWQEPNEASEKKVLTLDGEVYLKNLYPTDYALIVWMNKNIKGQPVILEAQGDSYTDYARISANTGLPTILGWTVHEWLWRGSYDVPSPRIEDVTTLYEAADARIASDLLKKYDVEYVVIGDLEHEKYQKLDEEKFKMLGELIYHNGDTRLYKIR